MLILETSGIVFYSSLFYIPQFFQVALSYSAVRSGVFLLPVLVSQTLGSFISVSTGRFVSRGLCLTSIAQGQLVSLTGRYRVRSGRQRLLEDHL